MFFIVRCFHFILSFFNFFLFFSFSIYIVVKMAIEYDVLCPEFNVVFQRVVVFRLFFASFQHAFTVFDLLDERKTKKLKQKKKKNPISFVYYNILHAFHSRSYTHSTLINRRNYANVCHFDWYCDIS